MTGFNYKSFVSGVVIALVVALGLPAVVHHVRWVPAPAPAPTPAPTPSPTPTPAPSPNPDWFGVIDSPQRALIASQMRPLSAAAPWVMRSREASDTRPILLYKAWTDIFSDFPPYKPQEVGDCVSHGHGHGNDLLQCIEWILTHGSKVKPGPSDIQETDTEALYAMSREVAGMLGRGDGSFGSAAVKAMTELGVVSR